MTRETRIGLLVGLVFIVMFGLVLSELTGKPGPLGSPSASNGDKAVSDTTLAMLPVVERHEVTPDPALPIVHSPTPDSTSVAEVRMQPSRVFPPPESEGSFVVKSPRPDDGGPVVTDSVKPEPAKSDPIKEVPELKKPEPVGNEYVVEAGDTLTKIARKQYGQGRDKEYVRIAKANNLKSDENLKIGAKLIIPPLDPPPAAKPTDARPPRKDGVREVDMGDLERTLVGPVGTTPKPGVAPPPKSVVPPTPKPAVVIAPTPTPKPAVAVAKKAYTVKSGDTFSRIAAAELHDKSAATIDKIRKANPNVDPNNLQIGQPIVIPG